MSALRIREATPADAEPIADLLTVAYHLTGTALTEDPDTLTARMQDAAVFVADAGGYIVGTFTLTPRSDEDGGRVLEVSRFAVLPSAQGRGIGQAMLDGLIRSARAQDVTRLVGVSAPNMVDAHRLYTRVGALTAPAPDGTIFALDLQEQQ